MIFKMKYKSKQLPTLLETMMTLKSCSTSIPCILSHLCVNQKRFIGALLTCIMILIAFIHSVKLDFGLWMRIRLLLMMLILFRDIKFCIRVGNIHVSYLKEMKLFMARVNYSKLMKVNNFLCNPTISVKKCNGSMIWIMLKSIFKVIKNPNFITKEVIFQSSSLPNVTH